MEDCSRSISFGSLYEMLISANMAGSTEDFIVNCARRIWDNIDDGPFQRYDEHGMPYQRPRFASASKRVKENTAKLFKWLRKHFDSKACKSAKMQVQVSAGCSRHGTPGVVGAFVLYCSPFFGVGFDAEGKVSYALVDPHTPESDGTSHDVKRLSQFVRAMRDAGYCRS